MKLRTAELALEETAREWGLNVAALRAQDRKQHCARARNVAYYVARLRGLSLPEIGRAFSRDPKTVLSGIRRVQSQTELLALANRIDRAVQRRLDSPA